MVNSPLSSFVIYIEVLEVVVEVYRASTQVTSEKGGVGCEDGADVDVSFSTE